MTSTRTTLAAASLLGAALLSCGSCAAEKKPAKDPHAEVAQQVRLAESYFGGGRVSEALEVLQKAIEKEPANASLRNYYGQLCFMAGRHDDAEKAFQKALEIDPYMTDARNNLGSVYDSTGRKDLAEQQYKKALEDTAYPTPEKVCLNLGQLYASQGRTEEAITQYRRAVEINPKYWRGHFELASALDKGGKLEEAAREYEVALPDYKGSGEYHYRLGLVYMKLGRPEKAREHFTLCGQLAPGSENASKAFELLKMIP
ncbi:MAG TPA: tetratricopeptide repeat protein, partial [Candidatus Sulfotelmatobacter sp.]|jgi:Tfp pilus assembly protein PilF|nr:tetratricopeptide repeat protein [Candidatus Sulfotelmatobacter sp.]